MASQDSSWYRRIKWTWLLLQCAMPVLAVLYLAPYLGDADLTASWPMPRALVKFLLLASASVVMVLWIIAESLLAMARFPLDLKNALLLVAGFAGQLVVLTLTGDSILFAAYAGLVVTLAALMACGILLVGVGLRARAPAVAGNRPSRMKLVTGLAAGMAVAFLPLLALWPPLWAGFRGQGTVANVINLAALAANIAVTVRTLVGFSIFGRPDSDPRAAEVDAEWERWAPQTVILLILAAVTAVMVAGISRAIH